MIGVDILIFKCLVNFVQFLPASVLPSDTRNALYKYQLGVEKADDVFAIDALERMSAQSILVPSRLDGRALISH